MAFVNNERRFYEVARARDGRHVEVLAPAKVNLTLEILGRRPDGYHDLRSLLMPVSLFDRIILQDIGQDGPVVLAVERGGAVELSSMCLERENLAVRAARLFKARMGINRGVRITILKRIPLGGGLGGGSSDAAGVLAGLAELWRVRVPRAVRVEMALALGSDTGALALGGAVMMQGRGERVRRLHVGPGRNMWMVIANDGTHCATAEIYRKFSQEHRFDLTRRMNFSHTMTLPVREGDVLSASAALHNGLEKVVFRHHPSVAYLAERLKAAGGKGVLLSGSGASVFALARDEAHGREMRRRLGSHAWSVLVQTLPDGVMAAHGPLEARVMVRVHVGQPSFASNRI